jgi:hypothetical protein
METFRAVRTEADLVLLDRALRALSDDLGDSHAAGLDALRAGLMGDTPAACGLLALEGEMIGAALYSPVFSTAQGAAGVYVSDLSMSRTSGSIRRRAERGPGGTCWPRWRGGPGRNGARLG